MPWWTLAYVHVITSRFCALEHKCHIFCSDGNFSSSIKRRTLFWPWVQQKALFHPRWRHKNILMAHSCLGVSPEQLFLSQRAATPRFRNVERLKGSREPNAVHLDESLVVAKPSRSHLVKNIRRWESKRSPHGRPKLRVDRTVADVCLCSDVTALHQSDCFGQPLTRLRCVCWASCWGWSCRTRAAGTFSSCNRIPLSPELPPPPPLHHHQRAAQLLFGRPTLLWHLSQVFAVALGNSRQLYWAHLAGEQKFQFQRENCLF